MEIGESTLVSGATSGVSRQQLMDDFEDDDFRSSVVTAAGKRARTSKEEDSECNLFTDLRPVCVVQATAQIESAAAVVTAVRETDSSSSNVDDDDDWMFCENLLSPPQSSFMLPEITKILATNLEDDEFFGDHSF